MKDKNTGKAGEDYAAKYLKRRGYLIIARNYAIVGGELDIVALKGRTLVPIRAIAEEMGYNVSWDGETEIVTMENPLSGTILKFAIGSYDAQKNNSEEILLDNKILKSIA